MAPRGRCHAALLAAGPQAFLTHRTAAGVYGVRAINPYAIEVTTPGKPRPRAGLVIHRSTHVDPQDVRTYTGLRVSSVPRMLLDLAPNESQAELKRVITELVHKNLFDVHKMRATLHRHHRRPGIAITRDALGRYIHVPRDKSTLERDFNAELAKHPDIPTPIRNVRLGPYEIDCHWPALRFALELDGRPWHVAVKEQDRDNAKDIWLQLHGHACMRVTDFRFTYDLPAVLADVRAFVHARRLAA